ncbi:hypothetical protein AX15_000708 [Amanita polypyramis BW_CC]|nr:hypothetical protein AX15_000708 [Amanita polypyramis BW_CC]
MPGVLEDGGPSYVSPQSAEVILSDVRPTRLKIETLKAINVLLDEFLFNILKSANSLSTDRLRASLLGLLPTSLGKEALLEAEVELRAYYERTGVGAVSSLDDGSRTFNLQYAFELLRMKCAAYSTLNDSDEDPKAEARVMERMRDTGAVPFTSVRIAPAALYLTAIVEAMCEHILSNVAKVTARDSSRTDAIIQDLYTALCEDESIYSMFKSMKVYDQIEQLSNPSKHSRNKSFPLSRSEKRSVSRSPHHESVATATTLMSTSNSSRTRISSETAGTQVGTVVSASGSRSSIEKSRVIKKFRSSHERDELQSGYAHDQSASQSESLRRNTPTYGENEKNISHEVAAALQEFDNLMRSSSTMKVSLTPDRLRTMEAYKQEKDQRAQKTPATNKLEPDISSLSSSSRRPSIRQVESIVEDEEGSAFSRSSQVSRHRQGSLTSGSNPSLASLTASRNRSFSVTSSGSRAFGKKLMRTAPPPVSSSHIFHSPSLSSMHTPSSVAARQPDAIEPGVYPSRTRRVQRNRESLDLDDIMNGSDDHDAPSSPVRQARPPATPRLGGALSAQTKDLISFLAEGPPEPFRAGDAPGGPSGSPRIGAVEAGKKNPGRLQRMISKLTLGGSDKPRAGEDGKDGVRTPTKQFPPLVPALPSDLSTASLSPLANRPIPPRYPRPPSPPLSSPSQSSSEEPVAGHSKSPRGRGSTDHRSPDTSSIQSRQASTSRTTSVTLQKRDGKENAPSHVETGKRALSKSRGSVDRTYPITPVPSSRVSPAYASVSLPPAMATRSPSLREPVLTPVIPVSSPSEQPEQSATHVTQSGHLTDLDAREMHHLMSQASSTDECRLILDMVLARAGIEIGGTKIPPPSNLTNLDSSLENTVVELFLGGETSQEASYSPRKLRSKRHRKGLELRPHTADESMRGPNTPQASTASTTSFQSPTTSAS